MQNSCLPPNTFESEVLYFILIKKLKLYVIYVYIYTHIYYTQSVPQAFYDHNKSHWKYFYIMYFISEHNNPHDVDLLLKIRRSISEKNCLQCVVGN